MASEKIDHCCTSSLSSRKMSKIKQVQSEKKRKIRKRFKVNEQGKGHDSSAYKEDLA